MIRRWLPTLVVAILVLGGGGSAVLRAQPEGTATLRDEVRERYEVVALEGGIGLVPRERGSGVGLIEVRDGAIAVDGQALTGRELRDRLGSAADLVLRVSYLDTAAQAALSGNAGQPTDDGTGPETRQSGPNVTRGDLVRVGGNVTVGAGERVEGDVTVIGGSADVAGEVTGDANVIGGSLTLGSTAVVEGDVNVIGGKLTRASGARVDGDVNEVGLGRDIDASGLRGMLFGPFRMRAASLAATVTRVLLLILLALVVVALAKPSLERIAGRAGVEPGRAGLTGLLAELLFAPMLVVTVLVLVVSIIGIPLLVLLPFALVLLLLLLLVGFTGVAYQVGRALQERFGWTERGAYAAVVLGVLAITGVSILGRLAALAAGGWLGFPLTAIGYLVEYVAWTVGLGSAILAWFSARAARNRPADPPSPPSPASGDTAPAAL